MADGSVKPLLLRGKELSIDETEMLESLLVKEKLSGLKIIVKDLRICLTGATRKQTSSSMARIGTVQEDGSADSDDSCAISYLTDETKRDIRELASLLIGRRTSMACWWSLPL